MAFNLTGRLGLDARDFTKGANQAADALEDVSDKLDEVADDAAGAGGKAGTGFADALGGSLGPALAGAGIGATLALAFEGGMDQIALDSQFEAQFGLVEADAQRYGQTSSAIYADGWGSGMEEVNVAVGTVAQTLVDTGEIAADETEKIATGALQIAEVFGADVQDVIRSTGQLMLNGLAPDAETALDIITTGFQQGGDRAGDFLDTIDEYSQHWAAFGISGDEALTMILTGFQNGQRDADKMADAVKEMRIRAVEDTDTISNAYRDIGLNADDTREAILAGGPAAREAFSQIIDGLQSVTDPTEQNRLAIELVGTQYEDLGPTALEILGAIDDATVDVTGSTENLGDTLDDQSRDWERTKRSAEGYWKDLQRGTVTAFVAVQDANAAFTGYNTTLADAIEIAQNWEGSASDLEEGLLNAGFAADDAAEATERYIAVFGAQEWRPAIEDAVLGAFANMDAATAAATEELELMRQTWRNTQDAWDAGRVAVTAAAAAQDDATGKYADATDAMDAQRKAATNLAGDLRDAKAATLELRDAQREMTDKNYAAERALWDVIAAQEELNQATDDGETAVNEKRLAELDAIETAFRAVDALTEQEVAQREANGEVLTAQQRQDIYRSKLDQVAGQLKGPMRDALMSHKRDIDSVPSYKATTLEVNVADALARLSALKQSLREAHNLAGRNMYVGIGGRASGGPVDAGTPYVVGEKGPELFIPRQSGQIVDAMSTSAMLNGQSAAVPITMTAPASPTVTTGTATTRESHLHVAGLIDDGTVQYLFSRFRELEDANL